MVKQITLDNKLRLIMAPRLGTKTVAILVMVRVGSRFEEKRLGGIAHFVEHMMFKGTKKRPTSLAITKELDGIGADFNAFTGKEYTGYYIKSNAEHLELAADILSDMLLNSKIATKELEKEKGVILEEMNMYEDNPRLNLDTLLEEVMFEKEDLGRSIIGTKQSVTGASRNDLRDFVSKFYQASEVVVGVAGKFNEQEVVSLIKDKFKFKNAVDKNQYTAVSQQQVKPRVKIDYKKTNQVHLAFGLPAYAYDDPRAYPLTVLSTILGGSMSSRLFVTIREKNGMAYYVRSDLSLYQDVGGLIIEAGLDKARIDKAIELILAELKKIKKGVTADELNMAKEHLIGKIALDLEDSARLASWYAMDELMTGKILTPEQKISKIRQLSQADVMEVAREVIDFSKLNLAIIGPFKNKQKFLQLLK